MFGYKCYCGPGRLVLCRDTWPNCDKLGSNVLRSLHLLSYVDCHTNRETQWLEESRVRLFLKCLVDVYCWFYPAERAALSCYVSVTISWKSLSHLWCTYVLGPVMVVLSSWKYYLCLEVLEQPRSYP